MNHFFISFDYVSSSSVILLMSLKYSLQVLLQLIKKNTNSNRLNEYNVDIFHFHS